MLISHISFLFINFTHKNKIYESIKKRDFGIEIDKTQATLINFIVL